MRIIFLSAMAAVALAGCNTIAGIGEDLQAAGNAMTQASDEAKGSGVSRSSDDSAELCGGSGASRRGDC